MCRIVDFEGHVWASKARLSNGIPYAHKGTEDSQPNRACMTLANVCRAFKQHKSVPFNILALWQRAMPADFSKITNTCKDSR